MTDTADVLHVGAHIDLPMDDGSVRHCEVVKMDDVGFQVKWYLPDGKGPFFCVLPHGMLPSKTIYRKFDWDDRGGRHEHFMKWHPDFKA